MGEADTILFGYNKRKNIMLIGKDETDVPEILRTRLPDGFSVYSYDKVDNLVHFINCLIS